MIPYSLESGASPLEFVFYFGFKSPNYVGKQAIEHWHSSSIALGNLHNRFSDQISCTMVSVGCCQKLPGILYADFLAGNFGALP